VSNLEKKTKKQKNKKRKKGKKQKKEKKKMGGGPIFFGVAGVNLRMR
jgi:hypothetical protein